MTMPAVSPPAPLPEDDSIDLRHVWLVLRQHKWGIIVLPILVMMLTYLISSSQTPLYEAKTSLLIEPETANVVDIEQVMTGLRGGQEYLATQFELIRSRTLAEDVVRKLNLTAHPELDPRQQEEPVFAWRDLLDWRALVDLLGLSEVLPVTQPQDLRPAVPNEAQIFESVVRAFQGRVSVSPKRGTQLVEIGVTMADPQTAAQAADALANAYIESQLEAKLDMTESASAWISRRMEDLKRNLQDSERRLQAFRERENLVDVDGVTTVNAQELSQISSSLVRVRQEFANAENQYRQIADVADAGWRRQATVPVVLSNPAVSEFRAEETRARARVDELSKRYGPKHPRMIEARNELNAAADSLRSQVEQVVASIERKYQLAQTNLRSLEARFAENKDEIQDLQAVEFEFQSLEREVETNRTLYDTFMTRMKETSATSDLETANARLVDRAMVPRAAVWPTPNRTALIAGVLALAAAIGLAFLREQLDNRVHTVSDVEDKIHMPVLGLLPLVGKKRSQRKMMARMFLDDVDARFSESVRTIRTGVVLSGLDNPHKVIAVTSSLPGEGKTSVAANLAFALGQMERVLLLEADMRRPTFRRIFDLPADRPGLANVAAETATLAEAVVTQDYVDVLACGTVPPNPLELLSSKRFEALLAELEEKYDRIVCDTPPVQAVSDPLVVSTHANAVLYVVKTESTPIPLVNKGLDQLRTARAALTGVVLNHVDVVKTRKYSYYGRGYGGRYHYGAGYGSYGYGSYGYGAYYDYYGYTGKQKNA